LYLQSPRLHCSIADTKALSKISNRTDASAAYLTVGSKMTPMCIGLVNSEYSIMPVGLISGIVQSFQLLWLLLRIASLPRSESSRERKFHPWNFRSWERKYVWTKVTVTGVAPPPRIQDWQSIKNRKESDLSLNVSPTSITHLTFICIAHKRLKCCHDVFSEPKMCRNAFAATALPWTQHSRPPSWIFEGQDWGRKRDGKEEGGKGNGGEKKGGGLGVPPRQMSGYANITRTEPRYSYK